MEIKAIIHCSVLKLVGHDPPILLLPLDAKLAHVSIRTIGAYIAVNSLCGSSAMENESSVHVGAVPVWALARLPAAKSPKNHVALQHLFKAGRGGARLPRLKRHTTLQGEKGSLRAACGSFC